MGADVFGDDKGGLLDNVGVFHDPAGWIETSNSVDEDRLTGGPKLNERLGRSSGVRRRLLGGRRTGLDTNHEQPPALIPGVAFPV
jgi:hypothetical protein